MVRIASLRLFCLLCLDPDLTTCPLVLPHARWLSRRGCHLPPCNIPFGFDTGFGLGVLAEVFADPSSSWCVESESREGRGCSKSGNLKVSVRLDDEDQRRSELVEVMADGEACTLTTRVGDFQTRSGNLRLTVCGQYQRARMTDEVVFREWSRL